MGALFSLGAGCQKWKPLDTPGTQPPLSDAVVNGTNDQANKQNMLGEKKIWGLVAL